VRSLARRRSWPRSQLSSVRADEDPLKHT
jgi:hypothetical protein